MSEPGLTNHWERWQRLIDSIGPYYRGRLFKARDPPKEKLGELERLVQQRGDERQRMLLQVADELYGKNEEDRSVSCSPNSTARTSIGWSTRSRWLSGAESLRRSARRISGSARPSPRRRLSGPPSIHIATWLPWVSGVIRAGGPTFTLAAPPRPLVSPEIILVRNVNGQPGTEIFVRDGRLSSGESVAVYTFDGCELREAGGFTYDGDSGQQHGLTCHRGQPARITQHQFLLQTGGPNALRQQTDTGFTWIGPKLERISRHTSYRRFSHDIGGLGFPPTTLTRIRC